MIYKKACEIAIQYHREHCRHCDSMSATEIEEGWVFWFGKKDVVMTPPFQILVERKTGHVRPFTIPPISNLEKLQNGKRLEFIE